jgi:hypothetical protein
MPHVPKRPSALAHVSDEAASIVLARHFGDFVKAARDLGVKRTDLRRLTWHNPRILNAAHERIELFRIGVKSKILEAVYSRDPKKRRWPSSSASERPRLRLIAGGSGRVGRWLLRLNLFERRGLAVGAMSIRLAKNHRQ